MTRVKERLNLFYHGVRTSERAELFADVRSWLAEMDDTQPVDERVKEIKARRERMRIARQRFSYADPPTWDDIDYLLSLLPVQPAASTEAQDERE